MNTYVYEVPIRVENNYMGLVFFAETLQKNFEKENYNFIFDFSKTTWFEANLVAVFASMIEHFKKQDCKVAFRNVNGEIKSIFKKNGFYHHYKLGKEVDYYNTTIPFRIFSVDDEEGFTEYLNNEVIPKIKLQLTDAQKKVFKTCLQEVFINAGQHAQSNYVYACGQYYYKSGRVAFTIVDIGITIGHNVRKKLEYVVDRDAINWATDFGNTTKIANDGGIGLHLLKECLSKGGILQIISGKGYWEQEFGEVFKRNIPYDFKGTVVNIISDFSGEFK